MQLIISPSKLNTWTRCAYQYHLIHEEGKRRRPSGSMALGRSLDAGVTKNYKQKITSRQDLPEEELVTEYAEMFGRYQRNEMDDLEVDWGKDDPGRLKDSGILGVKAYHKYLSPKTQPVIVQEDLAVELGGDIKLHGILDLVAEGVSDRSRIDVIDVKTTSGRRFSTEEDLQKDLQMLVYDLLARVRFNKLPQAIEWHTVKLGKKSVDVVTPSIEPHSDSQLNALYARIEAMAKGIRAGSYPPASPDAWQCSEKWCGFWKECPYAGR